MSRRAPHRRLSAAPPVEWDGGDYSALLSLGESLDALTRGCTVVVRVGGRFCTEHGRPVEDGSSRCESFVRRSVFGKAYDPTRRATEEYVRRVLGIKTGRHYRRLVERSQGAVLSG